MPRSRRLLLPGAKRWENQYIFARSDSVSVAHPIAPCFVSHRTAAYQTWRGNLYCPSDWPGRPRRDVEARKRSLAGHEKVRKISSFLHYLLSCPPLTQLLRVSSPIGGLHAKLEGATYTAPWTIAAWRRVGRDRWPRAKRLVKQKTAHLCIICFVRSSPNFSVFQIDMQPWR